MEAVQGQKDLIALIAKYTHPKYQSFRSRREEEIFYIQIYYTHAGDSMQSALPTISKYKATLLLSLENTSVY